MIIVHACSFIMVHAHIKIMVHACAMSIVNICTMVRVIVRTCRMIIVHVPADTIVEYVLWPTGSMFGKIYGGCPGGEATWLSRVVS